MMPYGITGLERVKNKVTQVRSEPKCLAEGVLKKICLSVTEIVMLCCDLLE